MKRGWAAAGVATALVAALAGGAFAGPADYSIVTADVEVAQNQTEAATAICPQGTSITGGGYSADELSGYRIASFSPNNKRNFEASMANVSSSSDPITLTAHAVCDETGKYSRHADSEDFGKDDTKTVTARCPRGTHVSGGGVGQYDNFRLLSTRPGGNRTWKAKATYTGGGTTSLTAVALCDHSKGGNYVLKTETAQGPPARPGRAARGLTAIQVVPVKAQCPRGTRATGGGWGIDTLTEHRSGLSMPGKRSWSARFLAGDGDPTHFTAYVLCKHD